VTRLIRYSAALLLLALSACAVGPDYQTPETQAIPTYKRAGPLPTTDADWRLATPGQPDSSEWWLAFKDPVLDQLMEELDNNNQQVQIAMANLRQAMASVREARASFFPVITASGSGVRGRATPGAEIGKTYSTSVSASWEMDIWGGIRRSVESASAQAESKAAELGAVLLSMRAELATDYFQIRTYDALLVLYDQTIEAYRQSLRITQNQYNAGTVTKADVAQATTQLRAAEAERVNIRMNRNRTEHAIAILLGRPPALFSLEAIHAPDTAFPHLPVVDAGLPSSLLERRPDIASAERMVASSNAAIGVAKSAHYPVLNLLASGGYTSPTFSRWLTTPHEVWSLGPSLFLSIFEGGALMARTDQAIAQWEADVAQYRQTVLQAFGEVENALTAARLYQDEEALQREAWIAAQENERISKNQYNAGTVNYLSVAVAQASTLAHARTTILLTGSRYATAVTLIRALGGGWDRAQLEADGTGLPDALSQSPPDEAREKEQDMPALTDSNDG
jgi:NodT family efflux transporter outer membrane factor (OMF) lipoprotein